MAVVKGSDMDKKKIRKAPDSSAAGKVLRALVNYHENREEVWMSEAEIGRQGLRVDLFTIKASWKPLPTVYEIKTSRADFKRDGKWTHYLPYCSRFYFACPVGLIDPKEIEDKRAGLVEILPDGYVRITKPAQNRPVAAKNLGLMLNRLLFKYMFAQGGRVPVQIADWGAHHKNCQRKCPTHGVWIPAGGACALCQDKA
jgi:hypothetical protein